MATMELDLVAPDDLSTIRNSGQQACSPSAYQPAPSINRPNTGPLNSRVNYSVMDACPIGPSSEVGRLSSNLPLSEVSSTSRVTAPRQIHQILGISQSELNEYREIQGIIEKVKRRKELRKQRLLLQEAANNLSSNAQTQPHSTSSMPPLGQETPRESIHDLSLPSEPTPGDCPETTPGDQPAASEPTRTTALSVGSDLPKRPMFLHEEGDGGVKHTVAVESPPSVQSFDTKVQLRKMQLLLGKNNVSEALESFYNTIEQSNPSRINQVKMAEFANRFGKLLYQGKKHYEAVQVLNRGLRIIEEIGAVGSAEVKVHWETHDDLAICHDKLDQDELEAEHYQKAIDILSTESHKPLRYACMMNNLGNCYKTLKQYTKARAMLEQAKKLKIEDGQAGENGALPEEYQKTIASLASLYKVMDLRSEAIAEYEYLITGIQAGEISVRQAQRLQSAKTNLSELYVLQGEIKKAEEVAPQPNKSPSDFLTGDDSNLSDNKKRQNAALSYSKNCQIGLAAQKSKNHQKAVEVYEQALLDIEAAGYAIDELSDRRSALSLVHNNLGNSYQSLGSYRTAEEHLTEALRIRQETYGVNGVSDLYGSTQYNLGNLYSLMHRREEALKHYREAVRIYTALGSDNPRFIKLLARSYKAMGQAYQAIDKGGKRAVEVYEKARSLIESINSDSEKLQDELQAVTNNLGNAYRNAGAYKNSEESLQTSLRLAESMLEAKPDDVGLLNDKAACLNNLGLTYKSMAKPDLAIDHIKRCCNLRLQLIRQYNSSKAREDYPGSLQNLGGCFTEGANMSEAIEYFRQAAEACREIGMSDEKCRLAMSICYENMGDTENALAVLDD